MCLLVLLLFLGLIMPVQRPDTPPERPATYETVTFRDIAYYEGDDADTFRHSLDLYIPDGADNFPIFIYIHGGAWVGGSKNAYGNIGQALSQQGIGVAVVNYRLSPRVTHPAHVQDVAHAFAWLADHIADYGGDPTRIVIGGHSAGGHIASLLVLDEQYLGSVGHSREDVLGVVSFSGVYVIDDWIVQWARGAFPDDDAGRMAASPLSLIPEDGTDLPPFLLLVSEDDYPELIIEHHAMAEALVTASAPVESDVIPDREHFSLVTRIGERNDPTTARLIDWLWRVFRMG